MKHNTPRPGVNTPHVRVPRAALDLCNTIAAKGAVMDLYEWADDRRYKPLKMPSSALQARWGMSARKVEALLSDLMEEGLIELSRPGTNRRARMIRVLKASEIGAAKPERSAERSAERSEMVSTETIEEAGTQRGTQDGTPTHARVSDSRPQTPDTTTPHSPPKGEPVGNSAEAVDKSTETTPAPQKPSKAQQIAEVWTEMEAIRCEHKPAKAARSLTAARRRSLGARLKDHGAEDVVMVARWLWTSKHHRAVFLRDKGHESAILTGKMADYLDIAREEGGETSAPGLDQPWKAPARIPPPILIDCPDAARAAARSLSRELDRIRRAGGRRPQIREFLSWRVTDADAVLSAIGGAA